MTSLEPLLDLQERDLALDRLRHRRETLPERAALAAAETRATELRGTIDQVRSQRDEVAREEKRFDDEAIALAEQAALAEEKLYSGEVSSPRSSRRCRPTSTLKRHQRSVEDRELAVMERREPLDARLEELETELGTVEAAAEQSAADLRVAESDIDGEVAQESAARAGLAAGIDADVLADYERAGRRPAWARPAWSGAPARGATSRSRPPRSSGSARARPGPSPLRQLRLHPGAVSERDAVTIYCDGGARGNPGPAAIGAVVLDPSTDPPTRLAVVSERIGVATNNVAEYRAADRRARGGARLPVPAVRLRADSLLVIRQLEGAWKVKQAHLRPLHERARELLGEYEEVDLAHVPREQNVDADLLVNAALDAPGT